MAASGDIITTMGVDDSSARAAMRDYQRFMESTTKRIDDAIVRSARSRDATLSRMFRLSGVSGDLRNALRWQTLPTAAIRRFAGPAAIIGAGLGAGKFVADSVREAARNDESIAGRLDVFRYSLQSVRRMWGEQIGRAAEMFLGPDNPGEELRRQNRVQESLRFARAEQRQIQTAMAQMGNTFDAQLAAERERHRVAVETYKAKVTELGIQEDLLRLEQQRHQTVLADIAERRRALNDPLAARAREDRLSGLPQSLIDSQRAAARTVRRNQLLFGLNITRAEAAMAVAQAGDDPGAALAAQLAVLRAREEAELAKIRSESTGLPDADIGFRLDAAQRRFESERNALIEADRVRRERYGRDFSLSRSVGAVESEITLRRLRGLEAEAQVMEVILDYQQRIAAVERDRMLTADDRAAAVSGLEAERDRTLAALLGRQARERALEEFGGQTVRVLPGGVALPGRGGRATGIVSTPGSGTRRIEQHLQKQVVTQERMAQLLKEIADKVGRPSGAVFQ